jgi:class III poly(R)-hydroxyalkanoic acid synthase PhaE subunit
MSDSKEDRARSDPAMDAWMKSVGDFWTGVWRMGSETVQAGSGLGSEKASASAAGGGAREQMEAAANIWKAMGAILSDSGRMESLFKGAGTMPEILMRMAHTTMDGFLQIQQKWVERLGNIGKTTEAYRFEDLDENLFRAWKEIYEKEFQRYLHLPQLGLMRFYQEKINRMVDKHTVFQSTLAEFFRLLYLPMSRSVAVLQEQVEGMAERGEMPEDSKSLYQLWIKILEGHYMKLFQSPEYVETLGKTLDTMSEFSSAKNEVLEDFLGTFPIPTQSEVDALYRELHRLKRRVRELEKNEGE